MPKVWNKRDPNVPKDAIYVGRPTKWGNPFKIGPNATRQSVVDAYADMLRHASTNPRSMFHQMAIVKDELKGKDLVCWCAPKPCHADVLLELANAT